jgi:manganese/zinc/iron transport system permease protein
VGRLIELLPLPYTDAVVVLGAAVLGLTSGVLGAFAVLRRRSLVGDAVAHAALPGVAVAFLLTGTKDVPGLLLGAAVAGVVGSLAMVGIERATRVRPDAAIGVVLSGFFSLGLVLLTYIASRDDADQAGLQNYLFGQAAGLLERDVALMAGIAVTALAVVAVAFRALKTTLFDPAFAASIGLPVRALEITATALMVVAVVIGIRMVGAILMVAMLVIPTVAARQFADRLALVLVLAGLLGAGIGVTGALASTAAALPTGPVIVLVGFVAVLAALLLAPGRGVVWRLGRLLADRRRAALDAALLDRHLADRAATGAVRRRLRRRGLADADGRLTVTGCAAVAELLDRRALWSAWLEHGAALRLPDAREADPRDLVGSLGDRAVAELRVLAGGGERPR